MNNLHIVLPYDSVAMHRMADPLANAASLKEIYRITVGKEPDPLADLNYHIPWHTLVGLDMPNTRHVMLYTHCNRGDEANLVDACKRAERIVCMSFTGRQELMKLGVDPEKLWVVYAGAGDMKLRRKNVGIVAFTQPNGRKRENILIDLMWQLDPKVAALLNFVVVGAGLKEVCQAAQNVGGSVEYYENLNTEQMGQVYSNLDLMLVTGYAEGGPLPLLEAFGAGVPVLSPRVGFAGDFLPAPSIYTTLEDLVFKLTEFVRPTLDNYYLSRVLNNDQYVREHSLLFAEILGGISGMDDGGLDRYRQLLAIIQERRVGSIVEIGTWSGERALQMIQQALRFTPRDCIHYTGFDLFEEQTAEHLRVEFSKEAYPLSLVNRRLSAAGVYYQLVKGNTRATLAERKYPADLYFIDGGHSVDTIASDWRNVSRMMAEKSVVVFDDYYLGHPVDMVGCNTIVDGIDRDLFNVERLPVVTKTEGMGIAMVKVTVRDYANLCLRLRTDAQAGSRTSDVGGSEHPVQPVREADAQGSTSGPGELGGATSTFGTSTWPWCTPND